MSRKNKDELAFSKINRTFSQYGEDFECDYDRTDCSGECDTYCSCRCTKIINAKVKSVNFKKLFETFSEHYSFYAKNSTNQGIFNYCLYRLLVINKLYDVSSWEVRVYSGYYGEETDSVDLEECIYDALTAQIEKLNTLSNDQVKYVLELEYGYLLDDLKDCTFEIINAEKRDLIAGNDYYRKKVQKGTYCKDKYKLPIGIYLEDGKNRLDGAKYRLIDGYHRFVDLVSGAKETDVFEIVLGKVY